MRLLLSERFSFEGRVDRSGSRPFVRGVLLCGPSSANRRRYKREAFAGGRVRKYEGRPVYLDHGDPRAGRRYGDQIGWVRNPRLRTDGMPIGDIEVKPRHPLAEAFLDDAEHNPTAVGMSHVANCRTTSARDGWEEVESVESVESVDVVLDPATTKGLYESAAWRKYEEGDGMDDDADPGQVLTRAFVLAAMALCKRAFEGSITPDDLADRLGKLVEAHLQADGAAEDADHLFDTDGDIDQSAGVTGESRRYRPAAGMTAAQFAQSIKGGGYHGVTAHVDRRPQPPAPFSARIPTGPESVRQPEPGATTKPVVESGSTAAARFLASIRS